MMDEANRAPVPEELTRQQVKELQQRADLRLEDLEKAESQMLDRLEQAALSRDRSSQHSQQAKIRTRTLLPPPPASSRGRGRR